MSTKGQMNYIELENRIKAAEKQGSDAMFASGLFKAVNAPDATIKRADFSQSSLNNGVAYGRRLYLRRLSDETNMFKEMDASINNTSRSCSEVTPKS